MKYQVLIVDDEIELTEYTAKYCNLSGVSTSYVFDADSCLHFFVENDCDLILLDINLNKDSGFELCQKLRKQMDIPILFISARVKEDDMILALNLGGDDYICKPYSLNVLLAKVNAVLKRINKNKIASVKQEDIIRFGDVEVDMKSGTILKNGKTVRLKAMEYKLLAYLWSNKNQIIEKEQFFDHVWETEFVGNVTLNVHIRHLREKIEEDPQNPKFIKTVWGVGFILEI